MYTGSDNGLTETYMMPFTGSNPQLMLIHPEGVDYFANDVAPEVIYDQGLYYPAADYHGYYCTGFEPQSEWGDHHSLLGPNGADLHYSALQTDSSPYVYYPPSYGYAESSYNPYNPYIPGAIMGLDGPTIATQQYFSDPSYQLPISSPAGYIPVVVQPPSDAISDISGATTVYGTITSVPSAHPSAISRSSNSIESSNGGATSWRNALKIPKSESPQVASSEAVISMPHNRQSSPRGSATSGNVNHMSQSRASSLMQVGGHFSHDSISSAQNPSKLPSTSARGWATVDRARPRFQFNGSVKSGNGGPDILSEQNKGPRTNRLNGQWASAVSDGDLFKAGSTNSQEAIIIRADQYNKDDFPLDYPNAKFFVIKSYSEDDVHKSIKYNVWSSTPSGNKKLDSAYMDAQRISAGKLQNCPIFLFFSVNASGQFCGVAEMIGPVDFDTNMDFWQQDKWTGSFPVKWHIIKDVPNTSIRHILLENNENKPVTNSRDTQEVTYAPGLNMLNIFKDSPLKTSILDDFMFYEVRQKLMKEEKSRYTGRSYDTYLPAIVTENKSSDSAEQKVSVDQSGTEDGGQSSIRLDETLKADAEQGIVNLSAEEAMPAILNHQKCSGNDDPLEQQVTSKPDASSPSDDQKDDNPAAQPTEDSIVANSVIKMKSLAIGSIGDALEGVAIGKETQTDVVTVGSMHINIDGPVEATSMVLTVGSSPVEPKGNRLDKKASMSGANPMEK